MRIGIASMFERARVGEAAKGTVKTETGLCSNAFSAISSDGHGDRATIYVMKGEAVLVVHIDGFAPGGAEAQLPQVRDLIRKLMVEL